MKLKKIASIFNRNKRLIIFNAPSGEQWIGNGAAMYSLSGMPKMTPATVLRVFDVPPDKHNKWMCEESEMPTAISFEDNEYGETEIEPLKTNIERFGDNFWLFPDGRRIYSFNDDFIKPLLDEPDYLTYHKRETTGGGFILACKIGMELKAIICPFMLHKEKDFIEEITRIADLYADMERQEIANAAYEVFNTTDAAPPDTDPDTGEIMDGQTVFE